MSAEVDVCFLTERGHYIKRKTQAYGTREQALDVFGKTVMKFKGDKTLAFVSIRTIQNGRWVLEKSERI